MSFAEKLKHCRITKGLTEADVASGAGISLASYYDLENHDDLETSVSLGEVIKIMECIGVNSLAIFSINQGEVAPVTPRQLAMSIESYLDRNEMSIDEFEEVSGWEISPFLRSCDSVIFDWNIECLRAVCAITSIDWLAVLRSLEVDPTGSGRETLKSPPEAPPSR